MFSEDIISELRDRVRDTFTALDQQTRLAVEHSMRQQLGIGDHPDVDCWRVFASRLYRAVHRIEEEWSAHRTRENRRQRA